MQDKVYTPLPGNRVHAVMTSWALIALIEAGQHTRDAAPLHRGAAQLIKLQEENGDFPQQVRISLVGISPVGINLVGIGSWSFCLRFDAETRALPSAFGVTTEVESLG